MLGCEQDMDLLVLSGRFGWQAVHNQLSRWPVYHVASVGNAQRLGEHKHCRSRPDFHPKTMVSGFRLGASRPTRAIRGARLHWGGNPGRKKKPLLHRNGSQRMSKYVIAPVSEILPGEKKLVTVRGRPIVIFNLNGAFFGLLNRCPHQGGSLCDGVTTGLVQSSEPGKYSYTRKGEIIRCPWHGWEFDIRTGKSWCEPLRVQARAYPVEVAHGGTLLAAEGGAEGGAEAGGFGKRVEGPYVAETIQVSVEDDYVVVDV